MSAHLGEVGPVIALSASELDALARKVRYEATIAADCAGQGRAHDPDRALAQLKKINALTQTVINRGGVA